MQARTLSTIAGTSAAAALVSMALMAGLGAGRTAQPDAHTHQTHAGQPQPINELRGETLIAVTGTGIVERAPDRAIVTVGAQVTKRTAAEAQAEVNRTMSRTLDALKELGLEGMQLQTTGAQLSADYDYRNNAERKLLGYQATNRVRVTVSNPDDIGKVLDAAIDAGANESYGVSFELRDQQDAQQEALTQAVADARRKAQVIAEAAGMHVVRLETIVEQGAQVIEPRVKQERAMYAVSADAAGSPTPVESGQIQVRTSVTVNVIAEPN